MRYHSPSQLVRNSYRELQVRYSNEPDGPHQACVPHRATPMIPVQPGRAGAKQCRVIHRARTHKIRRRQRARISPAGC